MRLTVVGCSGSFPGPDSPASCYLVEAEGTKVVLDLGSGALGPLQRHTALDEIDAVLLSHLHPDHFIDMCGLYVARRYHPGGPMRRIPVHGPSNAAKRVAKAYGLKKQPGMTDEFDFRVWDDEPLQVGPLTITVAPVNHPVEAYGLRVEHDGKVLTYSGDTDSCQELLALAHDADLFLCEASFHEGRDDVPDLHLTGRRAGEAAAKAGVGRLVLTHLPPWNDPERAVAEARETYAGPVEVAQAGAVYEI